MSLPGKSRPSSSVKKENSQRISKGQKTKAKILKKAIELMGKTGSFEITFEQLSKSCRVTRPLIHHYYPSQQALFDEAVLFIRKNYQHHVISRMTKAKNPKEKFIAYLESAMDWIDYEPEHMSVWLLYFAAARLRDHERDINTQLVNVGHERIQSLVTEIRDSLQKTSEQSFRVSASESARSIQIFLTGTIVSTATETRSLEELKILRDRTVQQCLKWALSNE